MAVLWANCLCGEAHGLNPHERYEQYLRYQWTLKNGFPGGRINSIDQTADGYLWIATSSGLVRFDGFGFTSVGKSNQRTEPIAQALTVVPDRDGALWVWDQNMNVQRYHHGRFEDLPAPADIDRANFTAIARSSQGGLLAATLGNTRVFEYRNGKVEAVTGKESLPVAQPQAIAETSDGRIWIATYEEGLSYWENGHLLALKEGMPDSKINCLLPVQDRGLWIGTDNGLVFWDGRKISITISAQALKHARVLSLARDRDGNIWIGTSSGLFRTDSAGLVTAPATSEASSKAVTAIFEDREGSLWVGDSEGIERLSDGVFATYSHSEGLPSVCNGPIYVDPSHQTWVAPSEGGLYRISNGRVFSVSPSVLKRDVIYSMIGSGNDLWLGRREGGLTHLVLPSPGQRDAVAIKTYSHADGLAQNSVSSVFISREGAVWAGTLSAGVSRLKDGKFRTLTSSQGLGSNTVSSIEEGPDAAMWFATSDGLSKYSDGVWRTYRVRDGLPSDELTTLLKDSTGVLWIGTSDGLAWLASGAIRSVADTIPVLRQPILGIAEDGHGFLWITTSSRVLRISRSRLLQGTVGEGEYREFDDDDGLRGTEGVRRDRSVVADGTSALWLSTLGGISKVDLNRLRSDTSPAIPHVESILSDGKVTELDGPIQIAAAPKRITIGYIAVSLAKPQRVLYRYRLEGFEAAWSEPGEARQVVYTNLGPGSYRFALKASNGNGAWDGPETDLPFTIKPTLSETIWFRLFLCTSAVAVVWLFYLYRLRLATARIQDRLDAQLEERVRIARELHDTLLQGFQGLMLRLQSVQKSLPPRTPAHAMLEQLLDRADAVLLEGRESVKDLRQTDTTGDDLSEMLAQFGQDLMQGTTVQYRLVLFGAPQTLVRSISSEASRIAREAIVNCFQHAQASTIEVEITYRKAAFYLKIRDDGVGIDPTIAERGRVGHWGLSGMRERAHKIGAKLNIWTTPGAGTEIELTIPAEVAYPKRTRQSVWSRVRERIGSSRSDPA